MNLMIVESPAKAKKIAGFLGEGWRVEACYGHVRDLPETDLGIDVKNDFQPTYTVLPGKGFLINRLKRILHTVKAVYVATDPDREGEAIAWHILALLRVPPNLPIYRVAFHAITREVIQAAVSEPRPLDLYLVEAQRTRRIMDRLVGYLVSALTAKALPQPSSTGRVQSVCLRLIVEREQAIARFVPQAYWTLAVTLSVEGKSFSAQLHRIKEASGTTKTRDPLERLLPLLQTAQFWVYKAATRNQGRSPLAPFTTASLQQAAAKGLDLSPDKTMALAQILYEQGWITYPRTDGISVAPEAQAAARAYIDSVYGPDHRPAEPPVYTTRTRNAQEAHEAIRPTDVQRLPQDIQGEGAALYALIWKRFIASQMAPAIYSVTQAMIHAGKAVGQPYPLTFQASGRKLLFAGCLKVYEEPLDEEQEEDLSLPALTEHQTLSLMTPQIEEHHTQAPARYTEASLIQVLEQQGIGRPSTYATLVRMIKTRGYVQLEHKRLVPTAHGQQLCTFLTSHFGEVLAFEYTAQLEEQLDQIASGRLTRLEMLRAFWQSFEPQLHHATSALHTPPQSKPLVLHPLEE